MENVFTWKNIGQQSWDGQSTAVAEIPNCAYGDDCYVICSPSPSGWAILAPLPKHYVDKLHAGKVKLYAQYKNPSCSKKFLRANCTERIARHVAEQLARSLMRETV